MLSCITNHHYFFMYFEIILIIGIEIEMKINKFFTLFWHKLIAIPLLSYNLWLLSKCLS